MKYWVNLCCDVLWHVNNYNFSAIKHIYMKVICGDLCVPPANIEFILLNQLGKESYMSLGLAHLCTYVLLLSIYRDM